MLKRIKKYIAEDRLTKFMLIFSVVYIISFFMLEQREVQINPVYCFVYDLIPFCELFVVPYLYWFVYMGAGVCYFLFLCKEENERKNAIVTLCVGMMVFILVSAIYPNGHYLRPKTLPDNVFGTITGIVYQMDTSTNILPSLHVFETVAISTALLRQKEVKERNYLKIIIHHLPVQHGLRQR